MTAPPAPDFSSPAFLRAHIAQTMAFYHPHCIDPNGGFFHYFLDDGTVYERGHRHLVSATRFVYNYAMASREFERPDWQEVARQGLASLQRDWRDPLTGGYDWTRRDGRSEDTTRHAYGMAFVLLAHATALKAGIAESRLGLDQAWALLEARFWEPAHGLYRDEATADWQFSVYRGQNANMHLCEALLAAYEATAQTAFLDRALQLADGMTRRQAALAGGLVWEHYDQHWQVDWDYHRDNPRHLFRPWGFQPGHQTEWSKLLLILDGHLKARGQAADWLVATAQHLFDRAVERAWDEEHGGLCYGFAPDGRVCDDDKYFWVQAESIAAAARLARVTGDVGYWRWYERLWSYAWQHFIDHRHGAWYRILTRDNRKYDNQKSPAGKTDYHTMGACHDVLAVLRAATSTR